MAASLSPCAEQGEGDPGDETSHQALDSGDPVLSGLAKEGSESNDRCEASEVEEEEGGDYLGMETVSEV